MPPLAFRKTSLVCNADRWAGGATGDGYNYTKSDLRHNPFKITIDATSDKVDHGNHAWPR